MFKLIKLDIFYDKDYGYKLSECCREDFCIVYAFIQHLPVMYVRVSTKKQLKYTQMNINPVTASLEKKKTCDL